MDKNIFYGRNGELLEVAPGTVQGAGKLADLEAWHSLAVIAFIAHNRRDHESGNPRY